MSKPTDDDESVRFEWRDRALRALEAQGIEPRHAASSHWLVSHGHAPICCCLMQLCRDRDACNVNAKIVDLMDAEVPA